MHHQLGLDPPESVRVSDLLSALSFALDLTEGQPMGHSLRTCLIGMELAERAQLTLSERRDLYYALILKDAGCSSNSARVFALFGGDERLAKHDFSRLDWSNYLRAAHYAVSHAAPGASWIARARRVAALARAGRRTASELVETRCERGADIVMKLGLGLRSAETVRALDEHWDGSGQPRGLSGDEIPMLSRIAGLAQVVERYLVSDGVDSALEVATERSGRWFDPMLVRALIDSGRCLAGFAELDETGLRDAVRAAEPGGASLLAGPGTLGRIAEGFADVVDAKSPFTAHHSRQVAQISIALAEQLGLPRVTRRALEHAALLHDIGKLSVPNSILDKPGPLNSEEWEAVRLHPYYTMKILNHIRGFEGLARVAAAHHERLDGRGYFQGLTAEHIPFEARILATADVFEALTASRPYRPALPDEVALRIMERDRGEGLCGDCLDALWSVLEVGRPEAGSALETLPATDGGVAEQRAA
ncbi:MAG TPA: HD domain-containing phosphohydrolase [Candidatus Udaeobacter sp.]|nr:HD domain-containing phosphohydrolase [Candidatus Udaeobacter sp.]